ncbi:MAG: magnesium/cobalt transporter CorA [Candidatus Omnitrophota bacterium]
MAKFIKKFSKTIGLVPGTLVSVDDKKIEKVKITIIDYDENVFQEKELKTIEDCFPFKETSTVTWIDIDSVYNPEIIEKIGSYFNIHPLVMEDIANTGQRPKLEDFEQYFFVVFKMLYYDKDSGEIIIEQISLIVGSNYVISFQEKEGDVFNPIRERIRGAKGRIRKMKSDYLAYSLLDAVVDNYFLVLEKMGDKIEVMEEELVTNPVPQTLQGIHNLKRDAIFLRKSVWPLREVINNLERGELTLVCDSTKIFLRDVYDHTIQVVDTVETFRDMVSGMLDIYLSSISNKMNEVMKVLTIIATIFIPITFVAGIYGMNFNSDVSRLNMPELSWRYGYLFSLGIMLCMVIIMIVYFKKKKWL